LLEKRKVRFRETSSPLEVASKKDDRRLLTLELVCDPNPQVAGERGALGRLHRSEDSWYADQW
jgi:hypothetical protein